MNSRITLTLVGALCMALAARTSLAQGPSAPLSRDEVKSETRAAEKARQLTPAGEGSSPIPPKQAKSSYTRAQRKAATAQARKNGELIPAGEVADDETIGKQTAKTPSTKTRAQRKAETIAARKAGQLLPAGEGPSAPPK